MGRERERTYLPLTMPNSTSWNTFQFSFLHIYVNFQELHYQKRLILINPHSLLLWSILHTGATPYQDIALLDTKPFGKVDRIRKLLSSQLLSPLCVMMSRLFRFCLQALVIDGKLQSAETDEFIYHECLVHPSLLHHPKYLINLFSWFSPCSSLT